jgi:iron complex transport system ATP-binding protein
MELTGTGHFRERRLCDLSDGERQKIMITRALVQESELILLDEPTSFLDMPHKLEIFQLLRRLSQEEGRSFLLSTHDLSLAISEADRLLIITPDGLIDDCPEQLILNGMIEKTFCRDGILFDAFTAEFKPVRKLRDSIILKGEGLGFVWTKKALIRELWQVFADEKSVDTGLIIEVSPEKGNYFWKLHTNDEECLFSDLTALLAALRKIRIS